MAKTIQEMILTLQQFWAEQGCLILQSYDTEKGAGTMSPYTFLRAIGPEPWNAAYVEPSRRPADGRYGENPNRLYQHHQFQVVMKPSPTNIQELYLNSLVALKLTHLRMTFVLLKITGKPIIRLCGLGWKYGLMEWKLHNLLLPTSRWFKSRPVTSELTYGLERLAMYILDVDNVYD